ncbi:MAG: peptidoglycan DD-metalloendopeptidase family protein [Ignavibacteria bacterium]|nr:peptidoglycan DD-metalloendopeptidase family protein [Ignavibacteria bacterium]
MVDVTKIFLFLLIFSSFSLPQQKEISTKKQELDNLKTEIQSLEKEIADIAKREKKSYSVVEKFNKQNFLLNQLINSYKTQIEEKSDLIGLLQLQIENLRQKTNALKANYARYAAAIYKGIYRNEFIYLFDAASLQQALARYKYLKQFSISRKKDLQQIRENSLLLAMKVSSVADEKRSKENLLSLKSSEENQLQKKLVEEKNVLKKFRNDKSAAAKELADKKQAEKSIKNIITRLIEKEELRKKELARKLADKRKRESLKDKTKPETPVSSSTEEEMKDFPSEGFATENFKSFSAMRGRMLWPVSRGVIIRKFGEDKNEKLKTVTLNYGIDIKVAGDFKVKAVGEGIVSAIEWLPGYGSIVIVTHSEGYRTVYGHLGQIAVSEGSKVSYGEILGDISESIEGRVMHFEIWKQRDHQNPEVWLVRK